MHQIIGNSWDSKNRMNGPIANKLCVCAGEGEREEGGGGK